MGIDVNMRGVEVESYGEVIDNNDLLTRLFNQINNSDTSFIRYIDPYGYTCFNCEQIPVFIKELKVLLRNTDDCELVTIGKKVHKLAANYLKEGNTYLEFHGD